MTAIPVIRSDDPLDDPAVLAVRDRLRGGGVTAEGAGARLDVPAIVREILADVQARGDAALLERTAAIDGVDLADTGLAVPADAIAAAHAAADREFLALIRRAAANIREYQQAILVADPPPVQRGGRTLGVRYTPVDRAAVYVPGGRAIYPSTVLMTVVPAQVAGVGQLALFSPPTCDGDVHPLVLALAGELGIDEVYRLGGALAVAAAAFGSETVRPVDMVVGPGNAFVAEAKRQVVGRVGIDSVAGPSEVLIVADQTARAEWIAADLLSQAEHAPGSAVLVTPASELAEKVRSALADQLATLSRAEATAAALAENSAIVVVADLDTACAVANDFATEHLQIVTAEDEACLARIRHAGAAFLGAHTPVAMGDYYAGPSHVLPTGGTARFFGPLSCNDFRKATSTLRYGPADLDADADDVTAFANAEGLTAHAASVAMRKGEA